MCTESLDILRKKINFLDRVKKNKKNLKELTAFDSIKKEDLETLKKLCDRFELLKQDNTTLMYQVTSYKSNVSSLSGIDKRAYENLPKIKEAEYKKSMLQQDIAIIESERFKLYDQFDLMTNALSITKSFSYGMILMTVLFSFMLAYMQVFKNVSVFYPVLIAVILLMVFITFVYIFRVRTARELKKNNLKQSRLISLQNKKTAVLASTQSFLSYSYAKFNVSSSEELEENLKEYTKLKSAQNRKNSTKRALVETEEDIKDFFKDRNLKMPEEPIEKLYSIINIEDKKLQVDNLHLEQKRIESELEVIENRQKEIWDQINELKILDNTEDKVVGQIVKAYHSKAEKQVKKYEK